jgi:hypothetical protein
VHGVSMVTTLVVVTMAVAVVPVATSTSTTTISSSATTVTVFASTTIPAAPAATAATSTINPRQSREAEAGTQRRIRSARDPRFHRLVAFHRAKLHFRGCPALLVGGGGWWGDPAVGDSAGGGELDRGARHVSALVVGYLDHQGVGQVAAQHTALPIPGDGSKPRRPTREHQVAGPTTRLDQNQNQKNAGKPERVGSHTPPARWRAGMCRALRQYDQRPRHR